MDSIENHFLDTNILIGHVLLNNSKEICKNYMDLKSSKIVSDNVVHESYNIIHKLENISLSILNYISNYISLNNVSDEKISSTMKLIEKNFLKEYEYDEYPFGFTQKKFNKISRNLFLKYRDIIKICIFYHKNP